MKVEHDIAVAQASEWLPEIAPRFAIAQTSPDDPYGGQAWLRRLSIQDMTMIRGAVRGSGTSWVIFICHSDGLPLHSRDKNFEWWHRDVSVNVAHFKSTSALDYNIDIACELYGQDLVPSPDLQEALDDLSEADAEAREEGIPVPSNTAQRNAELLLRKLYDIQPQRYEVYPAPDREMAVQAFGRPKSSVLLLCDSEGGVLCLVNMNGARRKKRYPNADSVPDSFVLDALQELGQQGEQTE